MYYEHWTIWYFLIFFQSSTILYLIYYIIFKVSLNATLSKQVCVHCEWQTVSEMDCFFVVSWVKEGTFLENLTVLSSATSNCYQVWYLLVYTLLLIPSYGYFYLGLSGTGVLSPAGSCQCLLRTGLQEQIQSTYRSLSGAQGKHISFLGILIDVRHSVSYCTF